MTLVSLCGVAALTDIRGRRRSRDLFLIQVPVVRQEGDRRLQLAVGLSFHSHDRHSVDFAIDAVVSALGDVYLNDGVKLRTINVKLVVF